MAEGMEMAGQEQSQAGGASQIVADINTGLMKLMDLLGKFPEDQKKLGSIVQAYQSFVDGLGQAPGQEGPQPAGGTTSPEAGSAKVQPVM